MGMSLGGSGSKKQSCPKLDSDSTLDLLVATPDIWTAEKLHSHNQSQTVSTAIPSILLIEGFFFVAGAKPRSAPSIWFSDSCFPALRPLFPLGRPDPYHGVSWS